MTTQERKLPEGWRWARLGEVCTVHPGQHILEADYNREAQGIGYLTGPADFGPIYPTVVRWTDKPKAWSEPGDVLVTVKGAGVGKTNLAPLQRVAIGRQLMAIRPKVGIINTDYLYHSVVTKFSHLQSTALGSTVPGLGKDDIEGLKFVVPPLIEQKRIAALLTEQMTAIDRARAAAEAQLLAAKELPTAFLRSVFDNQEEKQWPIHRLEEVCSISTGTTPDTNNKHYYEGNIPFAKTAEIANCRISSTAVSVSEQAKADCRLKLYPKGTLFIAMYGQGKTRGQVAILDVPAATTQNAAAVVPCERIEPEYLWWWGRSLYDYLRSIGYHGDLAHLSLSYVKALKIPVPTLAAQREIAQKLAGQMLAADINCVALAAQLDAINQLSAALLRKAFSGEL